MRQLSAPLVIILAVILLAVLLDMLASPARANHGHLECGPREKFVLRLGLRDHMRQIGRTLIDENHVWETWATRHESAQSDRWAMLITTTDGRSCIVRRGEGRMQAADL